MSFRYAALALGLALACMPASGAQQPNAPAVSLVALPPADAALETARRTVADSHFAQAGLLLRTYLSDHPRSAAGHTLLAYCLLRLNKPTEALSEYTLAAAIAPPSAEDLKHVAQAYVLLEDFTDATKWASLSVQKDAADPDAWYTLGRIHYTEQRFRPAEECFRKTLALAPKSVRAENNLGLALEGLNRADEAAAAYRQAIAWSEAWTGAQTAASPANVPARGSEQPLLNLAILLLHRGDKADVDQALPLLQKAVQIAPGDAKIHEQLGHLYLQQQALAAAQAEFEQASALNPGNAALHFLLGQTYRRQGLQQKAKAEFDRAAGMMGTHSNTP